MIPLSFAQQRLWFLDRLQGPGPAYNIPLVFRLLGTLDTAALESALRDVVERHESLRTLLLEADGVPYQRILDTDAGWGGLSVRDVAPADLDTAIHEAASHAFDLAAEPPLKATLFRVRPEEHVLVLLFHHVAMDDWSLTPLTRDLARAYRARHDGREPAWEPLPVQFADYAVWQREVLGTPDDPDSEISGHLEYWRKQLAGLPDQVELPTDRSRPAEPSGRGHSVAFEWDEERHALLAALARQTRSTVFMAMQAAVAALFTRLGAGDDIPLGTVFAARTDRALDDLVGFFTNTVVLRADTSGDPTFRDLLTRIRETNMDAHTHQDLPFDRLVEALRPDRSSGRHPLFQVMLAYQNAGRMELDLPGLTVDFDEADTDTAKFDLAFFFTETAGAAGKPSGMRGRLYYSTDLFDQPSAQALADRLTRLTVQAASAPDRPLGSLEILSAQERHRLIVEWNHPQPTPAADPWSP